MNNDRLLSFLGICKRAGSLITGAETVTKAVNEHKALLVLYASDVSDNSLKAVRRAAENNGVAVSELPRNKEELSFALGKLSGVIGITDEGFAKKILEMID